MMCTKVQSEPLATDVVEVGVFTITAGRVVLAVLMLVMCLVPLPPAFGLAVGQTDTSEFGRETSPYYGMNSQYVYKTGAGTSVAIDPWRLITASHYSLGVGSTLAVGSDTFEIVGTAVAPQYMWELGKQPDIKIIEVRNVTRPGIPLPGWYDLYDGSFSVNQEVILAGMGHTGADHSYYYTYDSSTPQLNRWGTNRIERFALGSNTTGLKVYDTHATQAFRTEYTRSDTAHEVGLADHDSGAGVFVLDDGSWKLAGLGLYITAYSGTPGEYDSNYAASIPHYVDWIRDELPEFIMGDANRDGVVSAADYAAVQTYFGNVGGEGLMGDANDDGVVSAADYACIQANFGATASSGEATGVPEPATVGLLLMGAGGLIRRKK